MDSVDTRGVVEHVFVDLISCARIYIHIYHYHRRVFKYEQLDIKQMIYFISNSKVNVGRQNRKRKA